MRVGDGLSARWHMVGAPTKPTKFVLLLRELMCVCNVASTKNPISVLVLCFCIFLLLLCFFFFNGTSKGDTYYELK